MPGILPKVTVKRAIAFAILLLFSTFGGAWAQEVLKGRVVDSEGNGVSRASVQPLNEAFGTATDDDGNFSLPTSTKVEILVVRAVGFATMQFRVPEEGGDVTISLSESVTRLPDLIVTAEKEEENVLKVPYAVSAMEAAKIADYRVWNLRELTTIVPNLYSANPGDNRNVTSIRGITTTSYDPAVATYIDGVNQFSLDTYIAPLFDVERIEVLRGPQGTLYGRNAMGGVINVITRAPGNRFSGFGEVSAGGFGQQRYALGVRVPVIADKLFFGAAGMYEKSDGYYTNLFDNSHFDKRHSTTGNFYLNYVPSDKLTVALNVKKHANRNNGAFTLENLEPAMENPYTVNQNAVAQLIDNSLNASLRVVYKLPTFSITSLTSYQSNHRYYDAPLDGDFSPFDAFSIFNDYGKDWNLVKVYTEEIKFTSLPSPGKRLSWTAGTYLFLQDNPVRQAIRFGEGMEMGYSFTNFAEGTNKGVAFYGQATLSLTDQLFLTAGLRYDRENREQTVRGEFQATPDPQSAFEVQPDTTASVSFSALSPKAGLQYSFTESSSLYATYSRGFRTGGLTQLGFDPSQPPLYAFNPEFSNNVEIGSKHLLLNNRLQMNLAVFYVQVKDAQVPTLVLPEAITVTRNTGELRSVGFETEFVFAPVRGLTFEWNFGLVDAKYQKLDVSQNGDEVNLEGNRQIFTPDKTSRLAVQYAYKPVSSSFGAFVRGEWSYNGTTYFDVANMIRQDAYSLLHARAGVSYNRIELSAWFRNILDEQYIAYAYDFGAVNFGEPANAGVSLKASF